MKNFENLQEFADLIPQNVKAYMEAFVINSQTAEAVHQAIATLIYKHAKVDPDDTSAEIATALAFSAHSAWINAFNMSVAGYIDSGWSEIRRAVEFTCYAAKVINSEQRAKAWIKQRTDNDARKLFSGSCQIPEAYKSDKYKYLRELLITYDIANYYGAHGNFETMIGKLRSLEENTLCFSYQANKNIIEMVAGMMILNGYRILQALRIILDNKLSEKSDFDKLLEYVSKTIINFRVDMAKEKYNHSIPSNIISYIFQDSKAETERMFNEMLERENERKKCNSSI